MNEPEKRSTTVNSEALTAKWNDLLSESAAQRTARIEKAVLFFEEKGDAEVVEFLKWFSERSTTTRPSEVIVKAMLGSDPVDMQHAWRPVIDQETQEPVGIGRVLEPEYYTALHVQVTDKGNPLYDAQASLAQHATITLQDAEGKEEQLQTAGISIAAHNSERGILVTMKATVGANPLADTLAFSIANLENLKEASKGPEGLKKLAAQTLKTAQALTSKGEPTVEDLLEKLMIVGNTNSGDENKETKSVLQALVEIPAEKTDEVAAALNGRWVSPDVLRKVSNLGIMTSHLIQAKDLVSNVDAEDDWLISMAQYLSANP